MDNSKPMHRWRQHDCHGGSLWGGRRSDVDAHRMNWETALALVIALTRHERYRLLCSDSWPDHEAYRRW